MKEKTLNNEVFNTLTNLTFLLYVLFAIFYIIFNLVIKKSIHFIDFFFYN